MNRFVNLGVGCIVAALFAASGSSEQIAIGSEGYSTGCDCGPGTGACTERDPGDAGTRLKALLAPNSPPREPGARNSSSPGAPPGNRRRGKQVLIRHTYQVELLEVDKEIPDSVFRLKTDGGRHVWDDDNRVHVQ